MLCYGFIGLRKPGVGRLERALQGLTLGLGLGHSLPLLLHLCLQLFLVARIGPCLLQLFHEQAQLLVQSKSCSSSLLAFLRYRRLDSNHACRQAHGAASIAARGCAATLHCDVLWWRTAALRLDTHKRAGVSFDEFLGRLGLHT